jgi:hypothetical protein
VAGATEKSELRDLAWDARRGKGEEVARTQRQTRPRESRGERRGFRGGECGKKEQEPEGRLLIAAAEASPADGDARDKPVTLSMLGGAGSLVGPAVRDGGWPWVLAGRP